MMTALAGTVSTQVGSAGKLVLVPRQLGYTWESYITKEYFALSLMLGDKKRQFLNPHILEVDHQLPLDYRNHYGTLALSCQA